MQLRKCFHYSCEFLSPTLSFKYPYLKNNSQFSWYSNQCYFKFKVYELMKSGEAWLRGSNKIIIIEGKKKKQYSNF